MYMNCSSVNLFLSLLIVSGYYALGNSGRALVDTSIVISQIGDLSVLIFHKQLLIK